MLNGNTTQCSGEVEVNANVDGRNMRLSCIVSPELVCGCGLIMGVDGIFKLGGVTLRSGNSIQFGPTDNTVAAVSKERCDEIYLTVDDSDFTAVYDGNKWTVRWKWKSQEPVMSNQCGEYAISAECRQKYDNEIEQWISNGWLEPHDVRLHGEVSGVIPLMAVLQQNKGGKVRPVMDYSRELNKYVNSNPGRDVAVCQEKLREWRKYGDKVCILDLQKAYLQLHIDLCLQRFQAVRFKGKLYVMTRMRFGLNVAPKVMSRILAEVLSLDENVRKGCDHYIDDIIVNEGHVSASKVRKHLQKFGLVTKEPEYLCSARVLGLRVKATNEGCFEWSRDSELPVVQSKVTKRELFSICGRLTGHYPVAEWLRIACSYIKREVNSCDWDSHIPDYVQQMLYEMSERVKQHDPVRGQWSVKSSQSGRVWCDASSIATGLCVEMDNAIVEDAAWLRGINDGAHINVAELEAVVKAINMAIKWNLKDVTILSDSATVCGWVKSVLADSKSPKVSGLSEMIVKRRLSLISELIGEYGLNLKIEKVKSDENKADKMTRVPQKWLSKGTCHVNLALTEDIIDRLRNLHDAHHLGVDRTLHLATSKWGSVVTRKDVEEVIEQCHVCKRVDPAPVQWENGHVNVNDDWYRIAADITHYKGASYLTVIDCGPSRYAIWRKLKNESASAVSEQLDHIFSERGSPVELLSDNGPCFRALKSLLEKWNVNHIFSCAYRASGNGIIERNHRTIKRMLARSGGSINDMLFWYNNTPNADSVVPTERLFRYTMQTPNALGTVSRDVSLNPYKVGDHVYVKPGSVKCTSVWRPGVITGLVSNTAVKVDGMTRHVGDVRFCWRPAIERKPTFVHSECDYIVDEPDRADNELSDADSISASDDENGSDMDQLDAQLNRPARDRKPPSWLADFYVNALI